MKPSVLIIDDETAILDALKIFLEQEDFQVQTTREYEDYLEATAPAELPDLIILDILLLNEDGREIATKLKSDDNTRNIPIVMISAHPQAKDLALRAGADAFLAKPFDMHELMELIEFHQQKAAR